MLREGIIGLFFGQFAGIANLLLPLSVAVIFAGGPGRGRFGLVVGALLILSFLSAIFWNGIPDDAGINRITNLHAGYFFWMVAVLSTGLMMVLLSFDHKSQDEQF